jgi:hypothetical protein
MISDPPAAPFQILFSVPVTAAGVYFGSSFNAFLELDAYGAGHQLLETQDFVGTPVAGGLEGFAGLQESSAIVELDVSSHPVSDPSRTYSLSIDNLEYQGSPVPEPSTMGLMVAGILVLAIGRRLGYVSGSRTAPSLLSRDPRDS